jgi:anthraniloyl-CoA monooxygenase
MRAEWPTERPHERCASRRTTGRPVATPTTTPWPSHACSSAAGADLIDVSSGQTTRAAQAGVWPHVPDAVCRPHPQRGATSRRWPSAPSSEADHANTIIAAGRADLCAIGRPHLADPAWTLHAAKLQSYRAVAWPPPYLNGQAQLDQLYLERAHFRTRKPRSFAHRVNRNHASLPDSIAITMSKHGRSAKPAPTANMPTHCACGCAC